MTSTATAPIGVVAHYNLLERLEPAGPGDLFRARDTQNGRTVTVRLLPAAFVADVRARAELIERAQALVALSHHNVTALFDVGEHNGRVFFVFEFLLGQSLRAEMAGRQMNVRRAVEVAIQIADAVADAHAAGFVHGGLSPDSILLTDKGHAKIPAFELASRGGFDQEAGDIRLRDYDSPEEARGEDADERSDVYSVGAILYEMIANRRTLHQGSAAPSVSNGRVLPEVDDIVLRAVDPNPNRRFQSAALFAAELRSVIAVIDARAVSGEEGDHGEDSTASAARVLTLTVVILLAVAALIWWFVGR